MRKVAGLTAAALLFLSLVECVAYVPARGPRKEVVVVNHNPPPPPAHGGGY